MKKVIGFFATLALVFSLSSFSYSGPETESDDVRTVFKSDFAKASAVSWTQKENFFFADFTLSGVLMGAAYDDDRKLIGTSRLITPSEMPAKLLKRAEGNFRNGHSTPRVLEVNSLGKTYYYLNIINDKFLMAVNIDSDGVITEESRLKLQK